MLYKVMLCQTESNTLHKKVFFSGAFRLTLQDKMYQQFCMLHHLFTMTAAQLLILINLFSCEDMFLSEMLMKLFTLTLVRKVTMKLG